MAPFCDSLYQKLSRRKPIPQDVLSTPLKRCLNLFDLIMLGVGNMIGAGVFILTGVIARHTAGPGVVLSYIFAGFAVVLAALCYAEYGARVPRAGSAYTYTYVTMGEFWAFVIGWDVILERMLGVAALGRGFSAVVDAMFDGVIRNGTMTYIGRMHASGLSAYPDFLGFGLILLVIVLAAMGVKFVANANNVLSMLNLVALVVIVSMCFWFGDYSNWSSASLGGFLPYGFQGVLAGAATLFYTYGGFQSITVGGEEASDPAKQIPRATIVSMAIVTTMYTLAGASLTLMVPFNRIDPEAPFTSAFQDQGLRWAVYLVSIGALFGIVTSIFADIFALPRVVYCMAEDGLLCPMFAWINARTQTPVVATVFFGLSAGIFTLLVDYVLLVSFLAFGVLFSFTMVSTSVLLMRYRPAQNTTEPTTGSEATETTSNTFPGLKSEFKDSKYFQGASPDHVITGSIMAVVAASVGLGLVSKFSRSPTFQDNPWSQFIILVFLLFVVFAAIFCLSAYEETSIPDSFQVGISKHVHFYGIFVT